MAKKAAEKQKKRPRRGHKRLLPALLIVLMLLGAFPGWMHMQARVTHLKQAQLYLPDLPAEMDGTTLLFVSDLNIRNASDARACRRLMKQLSQLNPDLLVLGGDYTAPTVLDLLNKSSGNARQDAAEFIESLADFPASFGKFAVTGENDVVNTDLAAAFASAGITYLEDSTAVIEKDGAELVLAGVSDVSLKKTPYSSIGRHFSGDECVIAIAHNPAAYIPIRVNEARGGGAWADLVLAGHNLGGQIKVLGRTIQSLPDESARCLAGWFYIDDLPMLVSQGVGCEGAMLRLGSQSEVWLLTLRRTLGDSVPQTPSLRDIVP